MTRRLILDTDVGTDVDDILTIAMIPAFDELALEGITLVYGDTDLRARITRVACDGLGIDVPILRGVEQPMSGRDIMWAGHEGAGVDGVDDARYSDGDAVDFLIEAAAKDPGSLDIVAIGPLSNIAAAVLRDPDFAGNVRHLTVMGGEFQNGWNEHNFTSDAIATWVVHHAGIPMTITPLDQTIRVLLTQAEVDEFEAGSPIGPLLADQSRRFWEWLATFLPAERHNTNPPHDPMALLTLVRPELFEFAAVRVDVIGHGSDQGKVTATPDASSTTRIVVGLDPDVVRRAVVDAVTA